MCWLGESEITKTDKNCCNLSNMIKQRHDGVGLAGKCPEFQASNCQSITSSWMLTTTTARKSSDHLIKETFFLHWIVFSMEKTNQWRLHDNITEILERTMISTYNSIVLSENNTQKLHGSSASTTAPVGILLVHNCKAIWTDQLGNIPTKQHVYVPSKKSKPSPLSITHRSRWWLIGWKWWRWRVTKWRKWLPTWNGPPRKCVEVGGIIRLGCRLSCAGAGPPLVVFSPWYGWWETPRWNTFRSDMGRLLKPPTLRPATRNRSKWVGTGLWWREKNGFSWWGLKLLLLYLRGWRWTAVIERWRWWWQCRG